MKKVLRITGITIGAILILLILIPLVFKSKIETVVKEKINESLYATVDWSGFSLSLFRGFPALSINLHEVSVVGTGQFEGDTLAGLSRFELRVNPFSAIRRNFVVNRILLDKPLIRGIVLENGSANWDIAKPTDDEELPEEAEESETGPGSSMIVSLKKVSILKGRIYYDDAALGTKASLEEFNLELAGDFSMEETEVKLSLVLSGITAWYGGIRYMKDGSFGLDLLAGANMLTNTYSISKNEIRINALVMEMEGDVVMMDDGGMDLDLKFFTHETSFQDLLSMIPTIYMKDFEELDTRGTMSLEARVKGVMKDSVMPDASLKLEVNDGFFAYPGLPKNVSDVQVRLVADYRGADMDQSTVDLEQFHLLLGGNPFEAKLHIDHPVSDMHLAGELKGTIDFSTLKDVVLIDDVALEGRMTADVRVDTRMSYIGQEKYEKVDLEGMIMLEGVKVETPDLPVTIELRKLEMNFNPRYVELAGLDLQMGQTDIYLEGALTNFIPYIFEGKTVSGSLKVTSALIDVNELMPETESDTAEGQVAVTVIPSDSLAEPQQTKIPPNIDFALELDLKKVIYEAIELENISGKLKLSEGAAYLDRLKMNVIEGSVTAFGKVDTRGDFTEADFTLDMLGIDIPSAYSTFVSVERLAPVAKFCKGSANVKLSYLSLLDASFSPLYESINANGQIVTKNLSVYNIKSFVLLSELLKNEKFREMAPNDMNLKFRIRDGRVIVDPFDMHFDNSKMKVSGSHGIDMSLDYLLDMEIAKSDMGEGVNEMMKGISALAYGAGFKIPESDFVKIKAKITGNFSDPKISTDLSGNLKSGKAVVKELVKEKLTQELEKVEVEVREDASEKADEIIKEAEAEVERIMEEARKAGSRVVEEAEKQGAELVKEAGSNPLKKFTAGKAADELVLQAKKQSDKLILEARFKADAVMESAKAEADKI